MAILRLVLALLGCTVWSVAPATAAPVRLSPEDADATLQDATDANAYFSVAATSAGDHETLYRRDTAGGLHRLAAGGYFLAESAVGTVVYTRVAQVPEDQGVGDDLYLVAPDGSPRLLTSGRTSEAGNFVGYSSLTPDGRGIVFTSSIPLTDEPCNGEYGNYAACDLYAWRDGRTTRLDQGHPFTYYRTLRGYATDDLSVAIIAGDNVYSSAQSVPKVGYLSPPGGGPTLSGYDIRAVSADRRSVILEGYDETAGLYRWNGTDLVTLRAIAPSRRLRVIGASPDLRRVFYALDTQTDAGSGPYELYLNADGADQHLSPAALGGAEHSVPADMQDLPDAARVAPDGSSIAFVTRRRLVADDGDDEADAYVWGPGGLTLASTGEGGVARLVGATAAHVAFASPDRLTCADADADSDVYVASAGTLALATPGTPGWTVSDARLVTGGDVIFGAGAPGAELRGVYRATPTTACSAPAGSTPEPAPDDSAAAHFSVTLKGAGRRAGRRGSRAVVTLRMTGASRAAVAVHIRRGRKFQRLLRRTATTGTTRMRLPYLSRRFRPGRRYTLRVTVRAAGQPVFRRSLRLRVAR